MEHTNSCCEPKQENAKGCLASRISIVIPTWKGERHWHSLFPLLQQQGIPPERILIVDSSSPDRTEELARRAGYQVLTIPQSDFNHGGTRQLALNALSHTDFVVFLTQDVVFAESDSILRLCSVMDDPAVGAAYGRQLPRERAGAIERHARLFNYPATGHTRTLNDRNTLGIRTTFFSNSFSVYRRSALEQVGGFPGRVITAEDSYVVTKMLMAGWKIMYAADATVYHSHPFTVMQEFKRYFDTGAHHAKERWILNNCGSANGEGLKFIRSECRYLLQHDPGCIPFALLRTATKLLGYRLGLVSQHLPRTINRKLSSQPGFWQ